jgi:hypothetical protein
METVYHKCAVEECKSQIPEQHLMCPPHWRKVPRYLQQIIWTNYRRRTFFMDYQKAVRLAKEIVATIPDKKRPPNWQDVLMGNGFGFRTKPRRSA